MALLSVVRASSVRARMLHDDELKGCRRLRDAARPLVRSASRARPALLRPANAAATLTAPSSSLQAALEAAMNESRWLEGRGKLLRTAAVHPRESGLHSSSLRGRENYDDGGGRQLEKAERREVNHHL